MVQVAAPVSVGVVSDFGTVSRRRKGPPTVVIVDPRRYGRHRGYLLIADRLYWRGIWTPLVRVRARVPRSCDGGCDW